VALVLGQFAHEVAVVETIDIVGIDAGVVECFQACLGEQIATGPFGVFPELRDTGPGYTWV
jgi:hypothetical protein